MRSAVDLRPFNTLALDGQAAHYLKITDWSQLTAEELQISPRFVLGGGSNLVLRGDFPGLILHMAIPGRRLLREDAEAWYVEAGAGENWHEFVEWTLAQGWGGLENLALIPGTVGAAPIQNIGAYGLEVGERLHSLQVWDFKKKALITVDRKGCHFSYRDSVFKQHGWHLDGRMVIVSVVFRLPKQWQANHRYHDVTEELARQQISQPQARDIANAIIAIRRRKLPDPRQLPNVGSFFQNPVVGREQCNALLATNPEMPRYPQNNGRIKLAAGWLIEQVGWKGHRLGPVGMYEQQALVLVNHGGASGDDVCATMHAVQDAVRERFGVELVPEPVFL